MVVYKELVIQSVMILDWAHTHETYLTSGVSIYCVMIPMWITIIIYTSFKKSELIWAILLMIISLDGICYYYSMMAAYSLYILA